MGDMRATTLRGRVFVALSVAYDTHQEALADVRRAYELTEKHDRSGRAHFMGWGTCRVKDGDRTLGNLNKAGLMGVVD